MSSQKLRIAVSLDIDLYRESQLLARRMGLPFSKLAALAVDEFVDVRRNRELINRINRVYADNPVPPRPPRLRSMYRRVVASNYPNRKNSF